MAKRRGPDGVPVDVPTHRAPAAPAPLNDGGDFPTLPPGGRRGSLFPDEPETRPAGSSTKEVPVTGGGGFRPAPPVEPKTRIHGGSGGVAPSTSPVADGMADPVVGWLVIIDGPGKGLFARVGNGQNMIGRSPECRIRLDFGDDEISRSNSAIVTYDPRGRRYYVQQGSGTNLIYLNDAPVLAPTELRDRSELLIGSTRLRFVALCGDDFSWPTKPPG